ncbi:MAG: DUF427 domain-containing protein [Stappiaceae bacterium]
MENGLNTLVKGAIHNPNEPRHFMRIKPVNKVVTISLKNEPLAKTTHALRLMEVGKDIYDPVFYLPRGDILVPLEQVADKETHCPLKGDASYWCLRDQGTHIAWSYDKPFEFADQLAGYIAFDAALVDIYEAPAG